MDVFILNDSMATVVAHLYFENNWLQDLCRRKQKYNPVKELSTTSACTIRRNDNPHYCSEVQQQLKSISKTKAHPRKKRKNKKKQQTSVETTFLIKLCLWFKEETPIKFIDSDRSRIIQNRSHSQFRFFRELDTRLGSCFLGRVSKFVGQNI